MDPIKLQQLLADLHKELSTATSVDPQSRRLLEQVIEDVRQLPSAGDAGGATAKLQEAALRLEAEHPRLASAIGQLGDALAKLGI